VNIIPPMHANLDVCEHVIAYKHEFVHIRFSQYDCGNWYLNKLVNTEFKNHKVDSIYWLFKGDQE